MEIKVYSSQTDWHKHKTCLCRRVGCPEVFDYLSTVTVLKALFGSNCVIEIVVV